MIRLQPIKTSDVQQYEFMEKLLVDSFPTEEYRPLKELRDHTDHTERFYNNIVFDNERPVGFITYWDFDRFYYAEHFATAPILRNGGYGRLTLECLREQLKRPIVLEVELPVEEMAKRRIGFYQRQGFTLWEKEYSQPPYRKGDDWLPMRLMVYGSLDADKDFEEVKRTIHSQVYGIDE